VPIFAYSIVVADAVRGLDPTKGVLVTLSRGVLFVVLGAIRVVSGAFYEVRDMGASYDVREIPNAIGLGRLRRLRRPGRITQVVARRIVA
jgi:hypothetical protein